MSTQPSENPSPLLSETTRRGVLRAGILGGGLLILQGCASRRLSRGFPEPVWPDKAPPPPAPIATKTPVPLPPALPQGAPAQAPSGIIPRSAWTRGKPRWNLSKPMNGVRRITIHHDAINSAGLSGYGNCAERMESIRRAHLARGSNWVDIGYHYVIDPDGRVWEGRPLSIEGAHVAEDNDHNLGVMVMGNFDQHRPTGAQVATLDGFVAEMAHRHSVPINRIFTHQELQSTACPGKNLQGYMRQTRASRGRMARLT
ncbi:MAG TPA: peptidoglycan recognition family protein [Phycisphaerales bacterium]|nr:peptidoglycan recognition family protein [Phycisphaerales bacterium]